MHFSLTGHSTLLKAVPRIISDLRSGSTHPERQTSGLCLIASFLREMEQYRQFFAFPRVEYIVTYRC